MKHNLTLPLTFFFFVAVSMSFAQELAINCTQTLRSARNTYDQGRLHEIPEILKKCLATGFSETERIEALKILVQTYIYLEEPGEADKAMLSLLETDHFFIPNEKVDPIEFVSLYKKFRVKPIWRAGVKFGAMTNGISVINNHYVWVGSEGQGKYSSKVGIQFGAGFEMDISNLKVNDIEGRWVLNPEIFYSSYSFAYTNGSPLKLNNEELRKTIKPELVNEFKQSRASLNVLVQYKIGQLGNITDTFIPYVALGPSLNYLTGASSTISTNVTQLVTGPTVTTTENYQPLTFSAIAAVGAKLRLGGLYINADLRLQFGLVNVVNENNRFIWQGDTAELSNYGYVDNDFRISQASINVGILLPKFSPKKLIK